MTTLLPLNNNKVHENTHSKSDTVQLFDALQLQTIELTAFVLGLLRKGVTTKELADRLDRNYSLAGTYLRMFDQFGWTESQYGRWVLTELGVINLPRFQEQ